MIVRQAETGDLPQLAIVFDEYRVFYNQQSDPLRAASFLSERIRNQESEIFVADPGDNTLAGFVQLYPIFSSVRMKRLWLLNDLYVNPGFRGRGISVKLLDRAKQLARETGAAGLTLETAKSNIIGNNLYPGTGFALDSDHNYYTWDCLL